jgi:hypothetical protein
LARLRQPIGNRTLDGGSARPFPTPVVGCAVVEDPRHRDRKRTIVLRPVTTATRISSWFGIRSPEISSPIFVGFSIP